MSNYHKEYDERTKLFRDAPAHDWSSHFADALRYLAVGWEAPMDVDDGWRPSPTITKFDVFTYGPDR